MNNVNILGSKIVDHKFFFPLVIILTFLIYLPLFNSIPFGDDYVYIFNNDHITGAPHPFVYWKYGTEHFKSWPLSFSLLWTEYKAFGENYFLYRVFNLILHILNALLFHKITNINFPKASKYIFILFLFHPMIVENIFWIFQVKTLLAVTFLFLSMIYTQRYNKKKSFKLYFCSLIFFLISLLAKSSAILYPFALFFLLRDYKFNKKLILVIPFFILSTILGLESIKGVSSFKGEENQIETFHNDYFKKRPEQIVTNKVTLTKIVPQKVKTIYVPKYNFKKYKDTALAYFKSIINLDSILVKTVVISSSLSFYLKTSLGLTINQIVYPDLSLSSLSSYLMPFFFFIFLFGLLKTNNKSNTFIFILILLFIPISGLLYVPYMQYSYVADHWFYSSLPFLLAILTSILIQHDSNTKKQFVYLAFMSLFLIQTFSYTSRLSDTRNYFNTELSRHNSKSQIIHEYLIEVEKKKNNLDKALDKSIDLYVYATSKRELILENILYLSKKLKRFGTYSAFIQKKSILHFINGSTTKAMEILNLTPSEYRLNNFIFLTNLYEHASKSIHQDSLSKLYKILKK